MGQFIDYISKKINEAEFRGIDSPSDDTKSGTSDAAYYNMVDEDTGLRFNIPGLDPLAPGYFYKYVYFMKLKERSPETFIKLTNWE